MERPVRVNRLLMKRAVGPFFCFWILEAFMAADSQKLNIMPLENYAVKALAGFPADGFSDNRNVRTR